MADVATLQARLEKLREMRAKAERDMTVGSERIVFRSDSELASAIADLERQIVAAEGRRRLTVGFSFSKGTL